MPTFTVKIPGGRIGHFLAGAVVASVIGGTAVAITDTQFIYSPAKTGFYSIGPADLQPVNDETADAYRNAGYFLTFDGGDARACFSTGVHLPQAARLIAVTTYYRSGRTNFHTIVGLFRGGLSIGSYKTLTLHTIEDNTHNRKSVTDVVPSELKLVRNDLYHYDYTVCLSDHPDPGEAGDSFEAALITYGYVSAGD